MTLSFAGVVVGLVVCVIGAGGAARQDGVNGGVRARSGTGLRRAAGVLGGRGLRATRGHRGGATERLRRWLDGGSLGESTALMRFDGGGFVVLHGVADPALGGKRR